MVFLAVDEDGSEWMYEDLPERNSGRWYIPEKSYGVCLRIPTGSIEKLIGVSIFWKDEPFRLS